MSRSFPAAEKRNRTRLWTVMPPRPETAASYAQRVPQAGTLLTPSFRPHLAMVALGVRLAVPVIRVRRGLAPPSTRALPGAHKQPCSKKA